ncbi:MULTISPECIES: Lrp/AsnC family transcriptional regulator [unclassified Rhodococcus (in: high G+C Gram-positive bacteria)]|uniref:Lrp/AsnC family transcriptional regulator n=1 Tax=unclassified Rhodococcus (in: high G+C Gram-positive bacteria) TaxID=192944 RepID=UPI001639CA99|nr:MULTISPECIES: Lrp/AsnC family transcriptional regulator [unclassified Rhodococcus (in: high G+C Gram-positive bacteria)]MBC2640403.1 Lrp/AsnC family transcriptional regulator [Rhodococcus sp. 3A]MBC2894851.1 Lrp/AsnC family transcriptional regulator [Rhodococcus sp. 4CII]
MQDYEPDDVDFALMHALQIEPRATWKSLAGILGVDPVALSRRFRRLHEAGLIWITGYAAALSGHIALVEVECRPGRAARTAQILAEDPLVSSIDLTAGGRDLLLTVIAQNSGEASRFLLHRLGEYPDIRRARTHLITEVLFEAGNWRLRTLAPAQVDQVPRSRPPRPRAARTVAPELKRVIHHELSIDGRASTTAIAELAGVSNQRVVDAIATMRRDGSLGLRTDIARTYSEWPVYAWYFMQVPATLVERLRTSLGRIEEVRLAVLVASEYNLILSVWLRTLNDVHRFEVLFEKLLPGARVADRSVVMQISKHVGHILDDHGRATGPVVPMVPPTRA